MIASLEVVDTVHTHTHTICLEYRIIASFLSLENNLISKISRVNFVYMFVMPLRI